MKRTLSNFTRISGMTYQGRYGYPSRQSTDTLWIRAAFRPPFSGKRPPFSYSRPPVRGGRWKIRRVPHSPFNKPWYAWSEGKAGKRWSRRFTTQAEAVRWAQLVASTYLKYPDAEADALLGNVLKYGNDYQPGWSELDR